MDIRSEEAADHGAIRAVHTVSFPTMAEARLVDTLRAAGRLFVSLVAEEQGKIVGHVAFSPVSVLDGTHGVGLARVAVLPAFRRRAIAEQLIRRGVATCRRLNHGFVVVLGDPRYYRRFGFVPASEWGLRDEYGGGDAFQALELRPGAIPSAGGVVHYAPEFAAVMAEGASGDTF
jgi:putative acetyltransferase